MADNPGRSVDSLLLNGSIADIGVALRAKACSIQDVTSWYLSRIDSMNRSGPAINAVREVSKGAMDIARRLDAELASGEDRGPLHGIPILLKDNILTADGMVAAGGARALAAFRPRRDATLVRRLKRAGAIPLGKTNLTEFADYVSDVMPSGFSGAGGEVKNPQTMTVYGRGLGSSVGSAASVAAALAPVAIGTETQNSIQAPACVSSIVGLKPTVGFVSRTGVIPLVPSQDSPGILARSIEDAYLVLKVIAGPDCEDTLGIGLASIFGDLLPIKNPCSLRIGVPRRRIADRTEFADVLPAFEAVLAQLSKAGITIIDPCDLPAAEQLQDVRSSVFRTEFRAALNGFLEAHESPCGLGSIDDLIRWNEKHPDAIPYGQSLLLAAAATKGLNDPAYRADRAWDIVLSRTAGLDAALDWSGADALIAPMSAAAKCTGKAGAPVVAIPAGLDSNGLPFGVTLFSSAGKDRALLNACMVVETIIGHRVKPTVASSAQP